MKEVIDKQYKKSAEQHLELEFLKKSTSSSRTFEEGYA